MTIINHECYVSLEVAKLLKEAGFDWEVQFFYRDGILKNVLPDELFNGDFEDIEYYYKHIGIPHQSLNYNDGSSKFLEEYSAPTLDVAQRWFIEVKKMCIVVFPVEDRFTFIIVESGENFNQDDHILEYNTYEEAQEEGIKRALELISDEGE